MRLYVLHNPYCFLSTFITRISLRRYNNGRTMILRRRSTQDNARESVRSGSVHEVKQTSVGDVSLYKEVQEEYLENGKQDKENKKEIRHPLEQTLLLERF